MLMKTPQDQTYRRAVIGIIVAWLVLHIVPGWLPLMLLWMALYFAPTIIAITRRMPDQMAIFVVNFLLGWTFIGWVVPLAWACRTLHRHY